MKEQAYVSLGKHLGGKLIDHKGPVDGVYGVWDKDEEVWVVYPPSRSHSMGLSRVIVISKKSGRILGEGRSGKKV
jgi:hypothetical protein